VKLGYTHRPDWLWAIAALFMALGFYPLILLAFALHAAVTL